MLEVRCHSHLRAPASTDLHSRHIVAAFIPCLGNDKRATLYRVISLHPARIFVCLVIALTLCAGCKSHDKFRNTTARDASYDTPDGSNPDGSSSGGAGGKNGGGGKGSSGNGSGGANGGDRDGSANGGAANGSLEDGYIPIPTAFDGAVPDGATFDAAALGLDAAIDLPLGTLILEDGAIVLPDGEVLDVDAAVARYTPEVDVTMCAIGDSDMWSTQVDISDEGGFSLVPGQVGFGLAYRGGRVAGCVQTLDALPIPGESGFGDPRLIATDCAALTDVSLLADGDGWRMAWVDNFTDTAELHTIPLDATMGIVEGATRRTLTNNENKQERKPVMRDIDGTPMVAWITEDVVSRARSISTQLLVDGSVTQTVVKESAGQSPQGIALAQMGESNAAVAWVGPAESPGVWLQPLTAAGVARGKPVQLTTRIAASSSVDLATRLDGGAAIYSIEIDGIPQIRFWRLDNYGQPVATERVIVGPPLHAQGASLATLGGGYAVAYRALPGGDVTKPEVRLTFVTKEGNVMRDEGGNLLTFAIGDATLAQGRVSVSVSVEGEVMVAWIDGDMSTGRNQLKVVRRRLNCQ